MLGPLKQLGSQKSPDTPPPVESNLDPGRAMVNRSALARARLSKANAIRSARIRGIYNTIPSQAAPDIATALSGLPAALSGITSAVPGLNIELPVVPKRPGGMISWAISKLVTTIKTAFSSLIRGWRLRYPFWFYGILIALILIILYPILGTLGILFGLIGGLLDVVGSIIGFVFGLFTSATE